MKILVFLLIGLIPATDPAKIGTINKLKKEAMAAYKSGDYASAARTYRYLIDSLDVSEEEVRLNLANTLFLSGDTLASRHYSELTQAVTPSIRSKAYQQLGVIANKRNNPQEALSYFKQSLKSDPANEDARYNYELLKKKLQEQEQQNQEQNQQNQDQNQQQQDQQKQNEQNKEEQKQNEQQQEEQKNDEQNGEQQEKQDDQQQEQQRQRDENFRKKLEEMNISEEKARMILEAMKNQEKQYYQQIQRTTEKPQDRSKPDW